MNIRREMTDVELCIHLVPEAGENYRRALDVMFEYPDYAKTQFRIVVEHLTSMLAKRFRIDIEQLDLFQTINELSECQIINHGLRSELHALRKAGNAVVHSKQQHEISIPGMEAQANEAHGAGDRQSAMEARKKLIGVFESIFLLVDKGEPLPAITAVEVGDFTSQQTLWKAITTTDFSAKMAAGLILEAQSMAPISKSALIIGRNEDVHKKTTVQMAAQLYWAACVISANVDRYSLGEIHLMGGAEKLLFKYADTEALYRYGDLSLNADDDGKSDENGLKALEVAASRNYAPACSLYGNYLREKGRYEEALKLLTVAMSQGDMNALTGLAFLYFEKNSPYYSPEMAQQCLEDGIARGSNHCEYLLGRFLYEGDELEKNVDRGRALIESAAASGHQTADHYNKLCVDDKLAKMLKAEFLKIALSLPRKKSPAKQGRNELCSCGSDKKYKKCCALQK